MWALPPSYLLLLALLCLASSHLGNGLNQDGVALLSFKAAVASDPEGPLSDWNSSDPNPCSWSGVTCKDGRVVSISLPRKRLVGSLPPFLGGALTSLRHLNLRNNGIHGILPPGLLAGGALQSLVIYGNSMSGPVPPQIGNLSFLQVLDISQNSFGGPVPDSLLRCSRLKALDLSRNNFTGPIPPGFGTGLVALERLNLSYNHFTGPIPGDIGNLSSLQDTVDFSHNQFSGPVPPGLGNLPEKVYIDLTYNNLSGPIPQNGALVNRGPTAFIGNPGLCGPPLKNPCSSNVPAGGPSATPYLPSSLPPPGMEVGALGRAGGRRGLGAGAIVAIVASDVFAISLIALVFLFCYRRATAARGKDEGGVPDMGQRGRKECLCFRKDETGTPSSENAEQLDLIPLDRHVNFDLDELLKASAFVLGKSGIGIVYKVVLEDGLTLAVRRLGEGGSQRFKEFQTEVEAIGKVRHPNIVTLRAYYWSIEEKLLIYDYIPNGNLSAAIHGKTGMDLPWLVRLNIMRGVAKGLTYLHEFSPKKYVHGDLKPGNILLGPNMEPYISDFGVSRLATIAGGSPLLQSNRTASDKPQSQPSGIAVSPVMSAEFCYQAPESLKTLKPSQKWDVYSYGVILLELVSGRSPIILVGNAEMSLVQWVQFCIEEKKPLLEVLDPCLVREPEMEDDIIAVLKIALACVQMSPERRPSMRHVLESLERLGITG